MLKKCNWLLAVCCFFLVQPAISKDMKPGVSLEVIDAYADVHSGPGRGYPVFYTIEQGEKIEILTRRPGWYEVRAENGRVGWATAAQISRTIQATGEPADLPSVGYGDYVKNSWVTGFSVGQFAGGVLEGYEAFSVTGGYRFLSWLGADVELGRLYGSDASGEYYAGNIYLEPFSGWKISPYGTLGVGELSIGSQPQHISFEDGSNFKSFGLGASYYLGRNFVIKAEYRWYSVSNDDAESLAAWKIGLNTFF